MTCARCNNQITTANSRDVYGSADPFDEPSPITDTDRTGWRSYANGYYCPACYPEAVEIGRAWLEARARARSKIEARHAQELAAFDLGWATENRPDLYLSEVTRIGGSS